MHFKSKKILRYITIMLSFVIFVSSYGISASAVVTCDIPISRSISSQTLGAGSSSTSSTELYLYPGDIVYLNFSYSPASLSVSFGLLTPSGTFRTKTQSTGICKYAMTINEEGIHKFRMKNNSSSSITVSGTYSTGCSYSFRSPYLAKTPSRGYSSTHFGLDIIESTSGAIAGYPIYSVSNGTVKVSTYSSSAGYYVVVVGNGGYTTRYLHMNTTPSVTVNQSVTYNSMLGYVGNSGDSYGYHLHLDVNTVGAYYGGSGSGYVNYDTTIDPEPLFPQISFT